MYIRILQLFHLVFALFDLVAAGVGPIYHRKLIRNLLINYDKDVPPINDRYLPNTVYFDLVPQDIISVSSRRQIVQVFCWNRMWWFDDRLFWNPADYGNLKSVEVMPQQIWTPNLYVVNLLQMDLEKSERKMPLVLTPVTMENGKPAAMVRRLTPQIYTLTCTDFVRQFPFDFVRCQFNYTSFTDDYQQLNLSSLEGVRTKYIASSLEWEYSHFSVQWVLGENIQEADTYGQSHPYLVFELVIRRRPTFYVYSMLVPACLAVQLSFFAMFLAADTTGDRVETVNLGFIAILGLSFLLIRVGEDTPKASQPEPLMNALLLKQVLALSAAIVTTLALIYVQVHGNQGVAVPRVLARILFCAAPKRTERTTAVKSSSQPIGYKIKSREDIRAYIRRKQRFNMGYELVKAVGKIKKILQHGKQLLKEDHVARENMEHWNRIIKRIEIVFLIIFSLWHCLAIAFFLRETWLVNWLEVLKNFMQFQNKL